MSARRSGVTRYRLEIFPPGTDAMERRALLRFRRWRVWGAVVALLCIVLGGPRWPGWQGPVFIAIVYIAGLALGLRATSRLRRETRWLTVASAALGGSTYVEGNLDLLENCATELEQLDRDRHDGLATPLAYEFAWSKVYARLEPAGSRQRRSS